MSDIAFKVELTEPFDAAIEKVEAALAEQGFGVLTRVNIHDAFKQKLGVDFHRYAILGACNPALAFQALGSNPEAGMMLPCNVTVEDSELGGSIVRIVNAEAMMAAGGMADDPVLQEVGGEAGRRLALVAETLAG